MTLHIINKPSVIAPCLARVCAHDTVILIEDGVYAALPQSATAELLQQACDNAIEVVVLDRDCCSRGIEPAFGRVTMAQFVELSIKYPNSVSWY